jgi:hypothetical protein
MRLPAQNVECRDRCKEGKKGGDERRPQEECVRPALDATPRLWWASILPGVVEARLEGSAGPNSPTPLNPKSGQPFRKGDTSGSDRQVEVGGWAPELSAFSWLGLSIGEFHNDRLPSAQ